MPAGPIAKVTVELLIASTNRFCPTVFGATDVPRAVSNVSPRTSLGLIVAVPPPPARRRP